MKKQIFFIGKDQAMKEFVLSALNQKDYDVLSFSFEEFLLSGKKPVAPQLILLDVSFYDLHGINIIQDIRKYRHVKHTPLIVFCGNVSEVWKAKILDAGADDCILKPVGPFELEARIRAVLRRGQNITGAPEYSFYDITVDIENQEVYKENKKLQLSKKEYIILLTLMENRGHVVNRNQLSRQLWDSNNIGKSRKLDIHIKTLRKKIGDNAKKPEYIATIRNIGYIIKNDY